MNVSGIIWTDKMRAVMQDDTQILFLGGATGCSKSLVAGIKFMGEMFNAPAERTQYFIIFRDIGTGVRNFLENKDSFYNMFSFMREPYKASVIGGLQFKFKGKYGDKTVYIVGANDKNSWSKVLGSNPDGIWLEELSVLHIDLIRELMGRAFSRRCKLMATTNGGLPTQEFYTEFLNHAVVQFADKVPAVEMAEMLQDKDYMHYYHFNLEDDAPHLTAEQKEKLMELYPENSFYYMSKILGCRGFVEGAAFATLMDKEKHLIPYESIDLNAFYKFGLFVDIGSNKDPSDTSKASTVGCLVGYTKNCQRIVVLECWVAPATSHDDIIRFYEDKINWWWVKYMFKFDRIKIDSAENILINTWRARNKYNTITVGGALKAYKNVVNLVTRCELKQQLIMQNRLLWSSHALNCYNAHTRLLLNDDGSVCDLGVQDNDMNDSVDYALTEMWNDITKNIHRE